MSEPLSVEVTVRIGAQSRSAAWEPAADGPWSKELRNLVAAFEVGQLATGMVADVLGGLAERTYSSPASRARRRSRGIARR